MAFNGIDGALDIVDEGIDGALDIVDDGIDGALDIGALEGNKSQGKKKLFLV